MKRLTYVGLVLLLLSSLSGCRKADPVAYYKQGAAAAKRGDNDLAITEYSKAIALNPRYTRAYINRGVAYWKKADYNKSIADETRAAQMAPQNEYAVADLAASQYRLQQYSDALHNTQKALEINPNLTFARFNLGLIYATLEDWKQAQTAYEIALKNTDRDKLNPRIEEIQRALKDHPQSVALKKALAMLQQAPSP